MFDFTALELARMQFAFTVGVHIIFPTITIGLASYLVVLEALWLARKHEVYLKLHHFWSKVFAVNFAMGVVSGIVLAYEFGTNWSGFSKFAGGVTGRYKEAATVPSRTSSEPPAYRCAAV
ncbi:cytochrome ubiquinol oxidase subunit I, partial [Rhizobium johnstonii]